MVALRFEDGHVEKVRYKHQYFTDDGISRIDIYTDHRKFSYFNRVILDKDEKVCWQQYFGEYEHFIDKEGFINERFRPMDYIPHFISYVDMRVS